MRLAIFGGTGVVGATLLDQALAAGHDVRALVRDPARLPTPLRSVDRLAVTRGDAADPTAVKEVVAGCDAVLSTLGGVRGPESMSAGIDVILTAMREYGVRRLVVMQGFHLTVPGDPHNPGKLLIGPIMRIALPAVAHHAALMGERLRAADDVDWTLVRAPRVVDGPPTGGRRTGRLRLGPWSTVTNGDVARFMLDCLDGAGHIHAAPMIAGPRR
jgi:putative NADH-flavin reductase